MTEPTPEGAPPASWGDIAAEAANHGFGIPDSAASQDPATSATPPKRGRGRPRKDAATTAAANANSSVTNEKPPLPPYREGMFVQQLEEMYGWLGMTLMLIDPICAQAVMTGAHECAVSLDKLAKSNHAVRRVLVSLTTTSAIGAVMVAHLPILTAILVHHVPFVRNMLSGMGITPAFVVDAMMQQQAAAAAAAASAETAQQQQEQAAA